MARNNVDIDDLININVGGNLYITKRSVLCANPQSQLYEWFKHGSTGILDFDKAGNFYLDRDPQTFRHILAYLRFKKEGIKIALALPLQPDELAKLAAESGALKLFELEKLSLKALSNYKHFQSGHFVKSYVNTIFNECIYRVTH